MGEMEGDKDDGSIMRSNLDGSEITHLVPTGTTHTPKQITISVEHDTLWWCDREGMRIMSCSLSGANIETLYTANRNPSMTFEESRKDEMNHCVGIAINHASSHLYWTQKGPSKGFKGRIFKAGLQVPEGFCARDREDVKVLLDELPEPIDLEYCVLPDDEREYLYWTDRGSPPRGNTVNRAAIVKSTGNLGDVEILMDGFDETIGISVVPNLGVMYVTDLAGRVYRANLDGSGKQTIIEKQGQDMLTGIWYAEI